LLYILTGEDDFSLNEALKEIRKSIGDESLILANTTTLEGETLKPDELVAVSSTLPFMTEKRLVVIRGLLKRFQTERKAPLRSSSKTSEENSYKPFASVIKALPESTVLVLVDEEIKDGDIKKSNPLFNDIKDIARVNSYPSLRHDRLTQWIENRVRSAGGSINPGARELLARTIGGNLWIMSNEIEKLVSFAKGRPIEENDVSSLVSDAREANIFALVNAVFEVNIQTAENMLQKLLDAGDAPTHILLMIARQLQLIIRMKDLKRQRKGKTEMQKQLGLADFAFKKTLAQAERYPFQRIKEIYRKLLDTDLAIKTGKYEEELALTILISELCRQS